MNKRIIIVLISLVAAGVMSISGGCICRHKAKVSDIYGTWRMDIKRGMKHDPELKNVKDPAARRQEHKQRMQVRRNIRIVYSKTEIRASLLVRNKSGKLSRRLFRRAVRGTGLDSSGRVVMFVESKGGRKSVLRFRFIDRDHVEVTREPAVGKLQPYRFFERVKLAKK